MKIFAVALVILLIKESKGAAIPEDAANTNKSTSWSKLLQLGHEVAKTVLGKLSDNREHFDVLFENSIKELYNLSKELEWNGVPVFQHIVERGRLLQDQLYAAQSHVQEAIGNGTYSNIHEKLGQIHSDIQQYRQNIDQITSHFNQIPGNTTTQVEEWHKRVADYIEPFRGTLSDRIEDLRKFLSPIIHDTKRD
ncbi:uncharacterized protein LOC144608681 [Rhinoraja longicauda]